MFSGLLDEKSIFQHRSDCTEEQNLISSLHSFLLAGIVCWLNEHAKEVKEYFDVKESSLSEKGSDGDDDTYVWLDSIIDMCRLDLFNSSNVEYIKNETLIKNLELKVAASMCNNVPSDKQEQRVKLTAVRSRNRKPKKVIDLPKEGDDSGKDASRDKGAVVTIAEEKVTENAVMLNEESDEEKAVLVMKDGDTKDSVIDDKESSAVDSSGGISDVNNSSAENSMKKNLGVLDCSAKDTINSNFPVKKGDSDELVCLSDNGVEFKSKFVNAESDIIKSQMTDKLGNETNNSELERNVSVKVVSTPSDNKTLPLNSSLVIEYNNDGDSKALKKLNAIKLKFESEKISTPNPFFVYFQLQNVLTLLLKDSNPKHYEVINGKIQESWKNAGSESV